jgi:hypothetical protein
MRRALLLAGAVWLGACSGLESERAVDRIQTPLADPSWSADIAPVLRETCGSSGACHGGAAPQQQLLLEGADAAMRAGLVDVPSQYLSNIILVRPGQPDSSFLLLVMSDDIAVRRGFRYRMPPTSLLMPAAVQQTIRNWIANGAPLN